MSNIEAMATVQELHLCTAMQDDPPIIITWLGALSNLDLQLLSICQELGSHPKAAASNLHRTEGHTAALSSTPSLHMLSPTGWSLVSRTPTDLDNSCHALLQCYAKRTEELLGEADLLDAGRGDISRLEALQVGEGWRVALVIHITQILPPLRVLSTLTTVALACITQV